MTGIRSLARHEHGHSHTPGAATTIEPDSVDILKDAKSKQCGAQKLSFKAFTGKIFTTLRAGLAFTVIILPKAIRLPALVAFLCLSTTRQMPGRTTFPLLFTAAVTTASMASTTFFTSRFTTPLEASKAAKVSDLVITLLDPPFMDFIDFIAFTMTAVWWCG